MKPHRVVIVGGGFGGLKAARNLRKAPVEVTLIDRRNYHLFQPLLYQIATGALSPANIAAPLRALLSRQKNARVLMGEVVGFDLPNRKVLLSDEAIEYDTLIVAAGSRTGYFGHDDWEKHAPGLKSIEDATSIRAKILRAFETAEKLGDPAAAKPWLTFAIVGAGPTGVEMAGAIAELAHDTLRNDFRAINPTEARIVLLEHADRVLPPFPADLSTKARSSLERIRVDVLTGVMVTEVAPDAVTYRRGDDVERLETRTIFWSAGVQASPLAKLLAQATGAELDRSGRIKVEEDLSLPGHPEVLVLGDMAHCVDEQGKPLPGVAPVAMQQGQYAARLISVRLRDGWLPPFRYRDLGTMATIGSMKAVVDLRGFKFSGPMAWFFWLFVHLMQLVQFESRLLVLLQWFWHYTTRNRSARLITGNEDTNEQLRR